MLLQMPDHNMDADEWIAVYGRNLSWLAIEAKKRGCDDLEAAMCLALRMHDITRDRIKGQEQG